MCSDHICCTDHNYFKHNVNFVERKWKDQDILNMRKLYTQQDTLVGSSIEHTVEPYLSHVYSNFDQYNPCTQIRPPLNRTKW